MRGPFVRVGRNKNSPGFTIVELLVVVVVIGILASIAIVSYNGIQKRAVGAKMQTQLSQVKRAVEVDRVVSGGYATDFPAEVQTVVGSDPTIISSFFQRDSGAGFCADSYSTKYDDLMFYIDDTSGRVQEGLCPENTHTPPDGPDAPEASALCFAFDSSSGSITGYYSTEGNVPGAADCPRDLVIPREISGRAVTSIAIDAFNGSGLTSVKIPDTVTSIGMRAFSNNQLTSVDIPDSVTSLGIITFSNNQLTSVTIPSSVTNIGQQTFRNNQLTSITIPNSVTIIGSNAFQGNQLTSVVIPDSVTHIDDHAFADNQLVSVVLSRSVTTIGGRAFIGNRLTSIDLPNSLTSMGSLVFYDNQLTSVTIPDSITSIPEQAFQKNNLTSIIIPSSVTSIGRRAFRDNQLTTVELPAHTTFIESIGVETFDSGVTIVRR